MDQSDPKPLGGVGPGEVLEVRAALTLHFWENFITQKLKNAPGLVDMAKVKLGLQPGQKQGAGLQPWSLGLSGQNLLGM